jgi:hypothetical protein
VAASVEGSYRFDWVVPDRVLSGRSELPALGRASAIPFYVRPDRQVIEMSSVGGDGPRWAMTGPIDGEVRSTPTVTMPDGGTMTLRFTRSAVQPDRFESRMEYSSDAGKTWTQGNRQAFVRDKTAG